MGDHCISLDPHYLSWKLKTLNYNARFIQLAGEINSDMPRYWVEKALRLSSGYMQDALNGAGKSVKGSRVLMLGVAYKKEIDDMRGSPALDIIELLRQKGGGCPLSRPPRTQHSPQRLRDDGRAGPGRGAGRGRLRGDRHRPQRLRLAHSSPAGQVCGGYPQCPACSVW